MSHADDPKIPLPILIGWTIRPDETNQIVEAEGTVTFSGPLGRATVFDISSDTGSMSVKVASGAGNLGGILLKSRIRVRGICVPVLDSANGKWVASLLVRNVNDITLLQLPEETWQRYPSRPIRSLAETNFPERLVHLRGKVQSVEPGKSFILADETGGIEVRSKQSLPEMAGTTIETLCGRQQQKTNGIWECVFSRLSTATNTTTLPVLTTAEQIRWLKPEEAARRYPIKVRGVITYFRSDHKGGDIQDGTGGIFIWHAESLPGISNVTAGDYCEVTGVTDAGFFSPQIFPSSIAILGPGQFPEPARPAWSELIRGGLDAQWTEIEGIGVSATATNRTLNVRMKGGTISCSVPRAPDQYIGDIVQVRGVVLMPHGTNRNAIAAHIVVPSSRFISIKSFAPADPFAAPTMRLADLFTYNPDEYAFQRVKFFGQLVQKRNDVLYVTDGTNGMRVLPNKLADVNVGDIIEAVGFPDIDSPFDKPLLTLRDAIVRKAGQSSLPPPIKISPDDLLNRQHDSTLVRIESQLLGVSEYPGEQVLQLQTGQQVYRARLNTASGQMPELQIGSRLELTGVYAVSDDKLVPFELLLNSPADIRVLELPSWWTVRHAIFVVSGLTMLIFLAMIWIGVLHRQVEKRTMQLSAANKSLTNEIAERKRAENELVQTRTQHLIEQERTRIARDLHDDLGSRVTRLVLLNELTLQNRVSPEGVLEHAREISSAAREMIQSLDETVWAVNPRNDTLPHLLNYLGQFAVEFLKNSSIRCRLDFPDHPPERLISAEARHNLFLALKEALNNIVRHAQAIEVWVRAVVNEDSVVFIVEDNGRGFAQAPDNSSADGLRNMRQRMEEIGGQFEIESGAGSGTKVALTFFWNGTTLKMTNEKSNS